MRKKPVVAKAPIFVERKLSTGETLRIPYNKKNATSDSPAWFQVAGPIELKAVAVQLSRTFQTKSSGPSLSVWVSMGPIWLQSNWDQNWDRDVESPTAAPIEREVKKVLAQLKQQVAAGKEIR